MPTPTEDPSQPATRTCPACLSAIPVRASSCAACGAETTAPSKRAARATNRGIGLWVAGGLACALVAVAAARVLREGGNTRTTTSPPPNPSPEPAQADSKPAPSLHALFTAEANPGQPVFGAWVRPGADEPAVLLILSSSLPATGALFLPTAANSTSAPTSTRIAAGEVRLHTDLAAAGVIGLSWPGQPTVQAPTSGAWPAQPDAEFRTIDPSAAPSATDTLEIASATAAPEADETETSTDRLDIRPAQLASTLILHSNRAVGFALGGHRAIAIGALTTPSRPSQTLAEWQARTRSHPRSPLQLLADALREDATRDDPAKLRELADDAAALARRPGAQPDEIDTANRLRRNAWRQLVRAERARDEDAARRLAREFHERDPNHLGLLDDALSLALSGSDATAALALYERLRPLDPKRADELADALIARLETTTDSATLERLSQAIPNAPAVDRLLARAYRAAGRHREALARAERAARDPALGIDLNTYRSAASSQRPANPGTVRIPYDPRTRAIRTSARIGGQSLRLLVDTGATYTSVPSALARSLRLAAIRKVTVHTASGTIQADLVALPTIEIGGFRLTGVRALVLDLPGDSAPGGRGLLGMNVLRRFQVKMDPDAGIMELTPRSSNRASKRRRRR